ncbi:MAG: hypothetical protein ACKOCV_05330 [Gemmatimonadota bacterium]
MTRSVRYAVDRNEGAGAAPIVVLVADGDGAVVEVSKAALGRSAVEGAILSVPLRADGTPEWASAARDPAEEARRRAAAADTLARLRRKDPGGDLTL